jgi:hypothetical protein
MNAWRYKLCASLEIDAPIEQVYDLASSPEMVPFYAEEIERIEIVKRLSERTVLVKSYLKISRLTFCFLYRYHYHSPTHYSGVQESRGVVRGYFTMRFQRRDSGTTVTHTEGLRSPIPLLAWVVGFIYFRIIARGGMGEELARLKSLVESRTSGEPI